MTKTTNLFLFVAISSILIASPLAVNDVFAEHKATHQSNAGGVPGVQAQIDRTDGHVTVLKEQVDSFFDVFFDIDVDTGERNTPDSFFDVWTEISVEDGSESRPDSFFDIFVDLGEMKRTVDSFFDVFTELSATDEDLKAQIRALEERIAELENPESEPTCAECSNNYSFGNRDCLDQFRNGEVNDPIALQECFAANLIIYEECLDSLSDEEYSMCVDEDPS